MGCAHGQRSFVWIDDLPESPQPAARSYVIASGELLSVRVWNQEAMSSRVRVRGDGMISMPFLNDVEAAGLTPLALAQRLQAKLADYFVNPVVTVSLEEVRPLSISVMGEVTRPGVYPVDAGAGVLTAIASAGGLTDFATRDRIYVLRAGGPVQCIRFRYEALTRAQGRAALFQLQAGDVVVVE
jgi:polysaccharide export outer membrane protein